MHSYAQTNIQLYDQLQRGGYADADLARVRDAYGLVLRLFSGHFRPNGKAFISHLVGTASVLAAYDAAPNVVIAGLLHAAYSHGRFRDPRRGVTNAKRNRVRLVVGEAVEELIAKYAGFRWNRKKLLGLLERIESLDAAERDVILIRLANELEEHLDSGMRYGGKTKGSLFEQDGAEVLYDLAGRLGWDGLANELKGVIRATESADIPEALVGSAKVSYVLRPPPNWGWIHRLRDALRR